MKLKLHEAKGRESWFGKHADWSSIKCSLDDTEWEDYLTGAVDEMVNRLTLRTESTRSLLFVLRLRSLEISHGLVTGEDYRLQMPSIRHGSDINGKRPNKTSCTTRQLFAGWKELLSGLLVAGLTV